VQQSPTTNNNNTNTNNGSRCGPQFAGVAAVGSFPQAQSSGSSGNNGMFSKREQQSQQ
jgi:hypothetical protein